MKEEQGMKINVEDSRAKVYTPYNAAFVAQIRAIGGARWDSSSKCWTVPAESVDQVREIMMAVYGETDQPAGRRVSVRLTFERNVCEYCGPVTICGKPVARAFGRDSGARVGDDVAFIQGAPESGGSVKNWTSVVPAGSVVVLHNVPEAMLGRELPRGVTAEVLEPQDNREALLREKERLLSRLAEIQRELGEVAE